MDISGNWAEFLLPREGPPRPLPRRSSPPRNAWPYPAVEAGQQDNTSDGTRLPLWDLPDYLAAVGGFATLVGLVLAFLPETRRGGALVPVGLILLAVAAYFARWKDRNDSSDPEDVPREA